MESRPIRLSARKPKMNCRVSLFLSSIFIGLGIAVWATDFITLKGEWTIYTFACSEVRGGTIAAAASSCRQGAIGFARSKRTARCCFGLPERRSHLASTVSARLSMVASGHAGRMPMPSEPSRTRWCAVVRFSIRASRQFHTTQCRNGNGKCCAWESPSDTARWMNLAGAPRARIGTPRV